MKRDQAREPLPAQSDVDPALRAAAWLASHPYQEPDADRFFGVRWASDRPTPAADQYPRAWLAPGLKLRRALVPAVSLALATAGLWTLWPLWWWLLP